MYYTKMIRNEELKLSFSFSFIAAIIFHLVALLFVKKNSLNYSPFLLNNQLSRPLKIERLKLIKPEEVERIKRVGIKNGIKKDYFQPDTLKIPLPNPSKSPRLTLGNLSPDLASPAPAQKQITKKLAVAPTSQPNTKVSIDDAGTSGHFYFNPKKEKKIIKNQDQDNLKEEAYKNITASNSNPVTQKISNFEIRYERPEGVSEDELNSDEKAYYSFFKRSYASYLSKLYATYDKVSIDRPGLERDFENKHLLIGKIDYDEKGNIMAIKILKSSESDNVHYFFEETLKQLNLPNPPKSFIKNKKQFSTYYQIQIN